MGIGRKKRRRWVEGTGFDDLSNHQKETVSFDAPSPEAATASRQELQQVIDAIQPYPDGRDTVSGSNQGDADGVRILIGERTTCFPVVSHDTRAPVVITALESLGRS